MTTLSTRVPFTCAGTRVPGFSQRSRVQRDLNQPTRYNRGGQCTNAPSLRTQMAPRAVSAPPSSSSTDQASETSAEDAEFLDPARPLRVLIAGGGIAGLVLTVALLKKGVDVRVFEQDMTAIRGEGKYRGPIQVRSPTAAILSYRCSSSHVRKPLDSSMLLSTAACGTTKPPAVVCVFDPKPNHQFVGIFRDTALDGLCTTM